LGKCHAPRRFSAFFPYYSKTGTFAPAPPEGKIQKNGKIQKSQPEELFPKLDREGAEQLSQ
jgi:hypothetical protein